MMVYYIHTGFLVVFLLLVVPPLARPFSIKNFSQKKILVFFILTSMILGVNTLILNSAATINAEVSLKILQE